MGLEGCADAPPRSHPDLQVRAESGDFDGGSRSHAGVKPALSDQLDAVEGEEEEAPVSSYVEVSSRNSLLESPSALTRSVCRSS